MAVKKRVVIVGMGSIGKRHARLLYQRPDVALEIVDPNPATYQNLLRDCNNISVHAGYKEMLATKPDIVLLATPHKLHADQAVAALHVGAHVFCEKPMTISMEDALRIKQAVKQSNHIFNVGFQLRFHPGLALLKSTIESGKLGNILHIYARVGTYITLVNSISKYQEHQKGALFYDYAHQPDIFLWLLKESPAIVFTSASKNGDFEFTSNPNIVDILCKYNSGICGAIHLNYAQMPERHTYEIIGDQGWALLNINEQTFRLGSTSENTYTEERFDIERDDIYRQEHQAFFDAIAGHIPPSTTVEEGMASVAFCDAALKSWDTGKVQELTTPEKSDLI